MNQTSTFVKIQNIYQEMIYDRADERTKDFLLSGSPWNPIMIAVVYLFFCTHCKQLTAKLPTYKLRPLLIVYNLGMVGLSAYMTYEFVVADYYEYSKFSCQPVNYGRSALAMRMLNVCWLYYISKYMELTETFMFALRKKYNQISFLHVYHHTSMIFMWLCAVKYAGGGQSAIFGGINSFVHTVMYTYYGLSAIGPHMQKYLWWKKYITILQLSQFVILFFFCVNNVLYGCDYPRWLLLVNVGYAVSLLVLFLNFYVHAYLFKPKKTKEAAAKQNGVKQD